jgi:tetratricopeptide (TPR) repeat protein
MNKNRTYIRRQLIILLLSSFATIVFAETSYKNSIYNAFINHDIDKWAAIIHTIETNHPPVTVEKKLELIDYYYGYIGYLIGKKQYGNTEKYIIRAEKLIQQVLNVSPKNATAYSYKGSFTGYRIAVNKSKAVFLGPQSSADINKACELDPNNVQAIIDKGNLLYYSPVCFGGDKKEALKYFLKGVRLIEKNNDTCQNWEYLNLLTIIAKVYERLGQNEQAKQTYEKILRHEPDFYWVKTELYPKFLARSKK